MISGVKFHPVGDLVTNTWNFRTTKKDLKLKMAVQSYVITEKWIWVFLNMVKKLPNGHFRGDGEV